MSYNNSTPTFTPFRSGCGMCRPSTDYYKQQMGGKGNYSNDGLIPESNGKNFFESKNFQQPLNSTFVKNNYDIDYSTAFGGTKGSKSPKKVKNEVIENKIKKSKPKTIKKGGFIDDEDQMSGGYLKKSKSKNGGFIDSEDQMSGGYLKKSKSKNNKNGGSIDSEDQMSGGNLKKSKSKNNKNGGFFPLSDEASDFTGSYAPFNYKNMKGGQESSGATPMDQRFYDPDMEITDYSATSGNGMMSAYGKIESGNIGTGMLAPYTASTCSYANQSTLMKTGGSQTKKNKKPTKPKKSMKGGQESSGATPMDQRFFDPDLPIIDYPSNSGNGINTSYGIIETGNVGTGMLAPYSLSNCTGINIKSLSNCPSTNMKTGGGNNNNKMQIIKKIFKNMNKNLINHKNEFQNEFSTRIKLQKMINQNINLNKQINLNKSDKELIRFYLKSLSDQKIINSNDAENLNQFINNGDPHILQFLKETMNNIKLNNNQPKMNNIKSNNNEPRMNNNKPNNNEPRINNNQPNSLVGGKLNSKKLKMNGSGGPIPKISDSPVTSVQKTVTKAIDGFTSFMEKLDSDYNKSVQEAQSIKIGNQRLIQGGGKNIKKSIKKKSEKSKKLKSKKGGSTGSDFALTLNSRGPSNAPDDYWGVDGETWFRQFNKTGDYIPNSQLQYAATPILAGENPSGVVTGYDMSDLNYRDF